MWPASMSRGVPVAFTVATELPCTSAVTWSANALTSSRQTRAGAVSNPDGPGVSSSRFRKARGARGGVPRPRAPAPHDNAAPPAVLGGRGGGETPGVAAPRPRVGAGVFVEAVGRRFPGAGARKKPPPPAPALEDHRLLRHVAPE